MYVWRQEWSPTNNKRGGHPAVQAFHTPMNMKDGIFQQHFRFTYLFAPTSLWRTPPCLKSLCLSAVSAVSVVSAVSAVSVVSVCFLKKQSAMLCLSGFAHRGCPGIWMIPPQTILKRCLNWHHWKCFLIFKNCRLKIIFLFPTLWIVWVSGGHLPPTFILNFRHLAYTSTPLLVRPREILPNM